MLKNRFITLIKMASLCILPTVNFSCSALITCASVNPNKVFNFYKYKDGGYVAVYTKNESAGMYSVGGEIYVAGLIRVKGEYKKDGYFYPLGYKQGDDITQDKTLSKLAKKYLPRVKDVWFGGDTQGFVGCSWFSKGEKRKIKRKRRRRYRIYRKNRR